MLINAVAPFAGAWIEIAVDHHTIANIDVAPFAGAWIEISSASLLPAIYTVSLPSRERGLKSYCLSPAP